MAFERHHSAWIAASLVTVASFIGATAYTQNRLARLDALSSTLEDNAIPSIEYLSQTAVRLTRLNQLMDDVASGTRRAAALADAHAQVDAVKQDIDRYLQLPRLTGEDDFWSALRSNVNQAMVLVTSDLDAAGGDRGAILSAPDQVDDALDLATRSVLTTLDFDVQESERMARDIRSVRQTTLRMIIELDGVSTLIALAAVGFAFHATRRHDQLQDELKGVLTSRITELDRFSGRVAHDILSPLGTIAVGLSLLEQSAEERGRKHIERSRRALQGVHRLVEDLLTFARSGAKPDPASACWLNEVLGEVVTECATSAEEHGIELVAEHVEPLRVPCAPGVAASIVENLVLNGIKYMGNARTVRRIAVRASANGATARLEVEDTGPGIPADMHAAIFEPFVRGPAEQVSGTGLGLATVKRLAESHRGKIGVESTPGSGSLFWVELPRLPTASDGRPPGAHAQESSRPAADRRSSAGHPSG